MPGFDGTGPMGLGPMTGGGRGFCSPWGIRANRRVYGVSRWMRYGYPYYGPGPFAPTTAPFAPSLSREQELGFLKQQAQGMRQQLEEIQTRISGLSAGKK